jgi:hypothetical protein
MNDERREPRHTVSMQGRYRYGSGLARDVVVTDLSVAGCKIEDRFNNLRPGSIISIRIGNIGPLTGAVMWLDNATAGIRFESPIHASVLDHMLITIDGWSPPTAESKDQWDDRDETHQFMVRVRPVTIDDVRHVLAHTKLSLPIASLHEIVELFHRLLEIVAIEVSDAGGPND